LSKSSPLPVATAPFWFRSGRNSVTSSKPLRLVVCFCFFPGRCSACGRGKRRSSHERERGAALGVGQPRHAGRAEARDRSRGLDVWRVRHQWTTAPW
jgi:hypothetical protein